MKALKCKPSAQFTYNYSINVLSKCSNIISHQSSVFEGRHNDHRSSKVYTSIVDLRKSTHRSSKIDQHINYRPSKVDINLRKLVNTSTIKGRHIDHRSSKVRHQSSKVNTSIFEGQHIHRPLIFEGDISISEDRHRSSKVDTSIFEDRRQKHRTDLFMIHISVPFHESVPMNRTLSSTGPLSVQ